MSSRWTSCALATKPSGVTPPSQRPERAISYRLSLTRSASVSRSICARAEEIYTMARPKGVEVSKLLRTETKAMLWR